MRVVLDFETRSEADIKVVGAWKYSLHPSTSVMCLSWRCSNGEAGFFHREHEGVIAGDPPPTRLFELMSLLPSSDLVIHPPSVAIAHNAFFERAIWINVCVARLGWPPMPDESWRCSAAQAAACSLPRALGEVGKALKLDVVKDEEGKRIMMKLSKPAKPTKKEPDKRWNENLDDLMALWDYCETDTAAEDALQASLPQLSAREQKIWEMSERMNARGIFIDVKGAQRAIELAGHHVTKLNHELRVLTGIDAATKRAKVAAWLNDHGTKIEDTTGETLDATLKRTDLADRPRRVMEIVRSVGRSSTKKYDAMIAMACPDARVRGTVMYHGAGTGRWAGMGLQPHNFTRGSFKDMDLAWDMIHGADTDDIELCYGDMMTFLSHALRGAITAPDGKILYCGDYSSIEARVVFWLAGEKRGLDVFRRGEDIYCDMASDIYGRRITKKDVLERFFGKQAILGLGFQMGFVKFLITCRRFDISFTRKQITDIVGDQELESIMTWVRTDGWKQVKKTMPEARSADIIDLALMKYVVDRYRQRYAPVVELWRKCEHAAIDAVRNPGKLFRAGLLSYYSKGIFLCCKLPSGRVMRYPFPEILPGPFGHDQLTYMGVHPKTKQWVRMSTFGGKLVENGTQAVARDIMADGLMAVDETEIYLPVMTVHDEGVSEADDDRGDLDEYLHLLTHSSTSWCPDLPIAAEGWRGKRYRK